MKQTTYSFPQMVDRVTRKITFSKENKSINECLGILLRTRPGELLGDPNYGCNLINRIFAYNGVIIDSLIREDILDAVSKYEPRIEMGMNDITIVKDINVVNIYIQYLIKESGEINQYNLEITSADNPDRL